MNSPAQLEASITVMLSGEPHAIPPGSSLADLVAALGHGERAVATALNQAFVPRAQRETTVLQPGDDVLLFQPIVGG